MSFEQKRNAERLPLEKPLEGTASGTPVKIVEISAIGCKIEHKEKLPIGGSATLRFLWRKQNIEVRGKVARTQLRSAYPEGMYYETGLKFADSLEEAPDEICRVVAELADPLFPPEIETAPEETSGSPLHEEAEKPPTSNLQPPTPESHVADEDLEEFDYEVPDEFEDIDTDTLKRRPKYVECALDPMGQWHRRPVILPIQPAEGFVTYPQSDSELDMLCRTYAYADPETRRLIRISLELEATRKV